MALVLAVGNWVRGRDPILTLILTGVVVGSLFGAAIALVKILADPYDQLPAIAFWLLGSFCGASPRTAVWAAAPLVRVGLVPLVLLRWRINVLSPFATRRPRRSASRSRKLRIAVIAGADADHRERAVAISGVIGWVGLVIPHVARMLVGAGFRPRCCRSSMLLGAAYLLLVDTLRPHRGRDRDAASASHRHHRHAVLHVAARRPTFRRESTPSWPRRSLDFGYRGHVRRPRPRPRGSRRARWSACSGPNGSGKTTLIKHHARPAVAARPAR